MMMQYPTRQVYNLFQVLWNGVIVKGGGVGVQSPFDAIAVQRVTLIALNVCMDWVCYAKAIEKTANAF